MSARLRTDGVFALSLNALVPLYLVAEATYLVLAKWGPSLLTGGTSEDRRTLFALLVTAGSAVAGFGFACIRQSYGFSQAVAGANSRLARHPAFFALLSGACVGVIVLANVRLIAQEAQLVLGAALVLRATVIMTSLAVDTFHRQRGWLATKGVWQEKVAAVAAVVAAMLVALPSQSGGRLDQTSQWLLCAYVLAYAARLHLMNRFKQLGLLREPGAREAYFTFEQIGFAGVVVALGLIFIVSRPEHLFEVRFERMSTLVALGAGGVFAVAGGAAVAILSSPRRNATQSSLVVRLAALAASIVVTLVLYLFLDGPALTPWAECGVLLFMAVVVLLAFAEAKQSGAEDVKERLGIEPLTLALFLWAVFLLMEKLAHNWYVIQRSPFVDDVDVFAFLGESGTQVGRAATPLLLGVLFLVLLRAAHRLKADIQDAWRSLQPKMGGASPVSPAPHPTNLVGLPGALSVQRLGWVVAFLTLVLTFLVWAGGTAGQGLETTKYLDAAIEKSSVVRGRALIADGRMDESSGGCAFCAAADSFLAGHLHDDALELWGDAAAALNMGEKVLQLRRSGALSEVEFHALWAGLADEVCRSLAVHEAHHPGLIESVRGYVPLLCGRIRQTAKRVVPPRP